MGQRILLGCFEVPGWGGASTSAYKLFEFMRDSGLEVHHVNLISEEDSDYYRYTFGGALGNPRQLAAVHNCFLAGPVYSPHPELTTLIRDLAPDLLLGVGFIAALLMKRAAPETKLVFLTSGCQQMKNAIIRGKVSDFLSQEKVMECAVLPPSISSLEEREAVARADLVVCHSEMTHRLHRYFFPSYAGKIHPEVIWFGEWIHQDALSYATVRRPFAQREIDVLFVASSWSRPEKNFPLVEEIASRARNCSVHIVGEVEREVSCATHHGLIAEREELFSLMGNAKTVVCPSTFDAAPGILFEASAMGCNVVASRNCGNWRLCHKELLVEPFSAAQFLQKIGYALSRKYEDNMRLFLGSGSYRNLLETLTVI
jgi:glycosyltransferase involved in cell wall biosynthesis